MLITHDKRDQRWFPKDAGKGGSLPVYSVGDSAFQASMINENVP